MSDDLGRVLVVIPTYNERENIDMITARLRTAVPEAHILIADDNSPDGTGQRADELAAADDHIHVLHRLGKEGLGAAYLAGFGWGLERGYGVLVEHDADGSHQPEQLPLLLDALRDADMVKGSRWVPGGKVVNWPRSREMLSRGGSLWTRMMLGVPLRDATGGFNAFRAATLRGIRFDEIASAGYCFQIDLAWRALKAGYRVVEVPITFVEREYGESKMSQKIVAEALIRTTWWGVKHRTRQLRGLADKSVASWPDMSATSAAATPAAAAGSCRPVLVAMVALPILEIWLIVQVGQMIGVWWTLAILVGEALLGAWLMRREGTRAWKALNEAFASGKMPTGELADTALVLVGGVLLMLPGFVTDVFGLLFLLPFTRPLARKVLAFCVARRMSRLGLSGAYVRRDGHGDRGRDRAGPRGPTAAGPRPAGTGDHRRRDRGRPPLAPACGSARPNVNNSAGDAPPRSWCGQSDLRVLEHARSAVDLGQALFRERLVAA